MLFSVRLGTDKSRTVIGLYGFFMAYKNGRRHGVPPCGSSYGDNVIIRNINAQRLYFGAEVLFDFTLALRHYCVIIIGVGHLGVEADNIRTCGFLQCFGNGFCVAV